MTLAPECQVAVDGFLAFCLLAAIPIAILVTGATLLAYRWRVGRAMRQRVSAERPEPVPATRPPATDLRIVLRGDETVAEAAGSAGQRSAWRGLRGVTLVYALAGMTHAAVFTSLQFGLDAETDVRPVRWLAFWIVYVWPVVPVLMVTAITGVRRKLALAIVYFIALGAADLALEVTGVRIQSAPGQLFVLWAVTMGVPTALLLVLSNRAWRAVGLLAFLLAFLGVFGYMAAFQALGCLALSIRSPGLMDLRWPFTAVVVLGLVWGGWRVLRATAGAYERKRLSDQSLTLDSWWLTITLLGVVLTSTPYGLASLAFASAFVAYKVVVWIGLGRVRPVTPPRTLLLLRVFGQSRRSRRLLDDVGQRWRYAGPMAMIGGTDLATACLEPDELLRFWRGRLSESFVRDSAALAAHLARLDTTPDPDTRYRVNEFFCQDDTWQPMVRELARRSDAILMDLRGFSPDAHRGCRYELGVLLADVPLDRVVLLVDPATPTEPLEATLREQWRAQPDESVNRKSLAPTVRIFRASRRARDLAALLSDVFGAAGVRPR